ncbi:MAG: cupin domain-containing protein [Myxococcota bacterium]|nr:cupin domain-containing protein [Myxococcota bacterium]
MPGRHWLALLLLPLACASPGDGASPGPQDPADASAVLMARFPTGWRVGELDQLAEGVDLAPDQDFLVEEIGRDQSTSHHAVWIRDREQPHRHDRHDLWVVIVRGYGTMRIGERETPVGTGSVLYVPRATVHAFDNQSDDVAFALAVYAPPFDGEDRHPAE